jgi:hypothetical protein
LCGGVGRPDRLRETSTGDEYEMDERSILQGNLNRPGAVESKGAGMPSWLPVYPDARPSPKGKIHWMLHSPQRNSSPGTQ